VKLQEVWEGAEGVQGVPEALIDAYKTVLSQDLPGGTKVRHYDSGRALRALTDI